MEKLPLAFLLVLSYLFGNSIFGHLPAPSSGTPFQTERKMPFAIADRGYTHARRNNTKRKRRW
jgi:hypothetical protein